MLHLQVLDHGRLKPVPEIHWVVGCPDDKGANNYKGYLNGPHPCFGYDVCSTLPRSADRTWRLLNFKKRHDSKNINI